MGDRTRNDAREGRRRRRWPAWLALGVLLVAAAVWWRSGERQEERYDGPTSPVARGPLTISVSEAGTIEARQKVVLKCEVDERSTTITYLVPEGTPVEAGEVVVELDASVLQDELYDEEIDVLDTEAEYLSSKENLEVVRNQAQADVAQAELTLRFAREDVKKYVEGEYPRQLLEATNNVTLARERMQQARDRLDWSTKLSERGFLAGSELDRDRLAFQSAELEVELAQSEAELLKTYTHARELAQLESDVEQAELALERVRRKSAAEVVLAETNLQARERQFERQKAQLTDIQQQVENCVIRAPVAGMVVYATTGRGDFRGNEEPLEVGREVRQQEELVHIPVADAKSVRIKVHESVLDKVSVGQEVTVTVDALSGRVFRGEVARISPLPDGQSQWLNPDLKVYDTEIHLTGTLEGLRSGMTCRAEILIERYEDALYVPVHCVVRIGDRPTVFVAEDQRLVAREVQVGLDNNRMIRIVSGLREGELVALAPPLEDSGVPTATAREAAASPEEADAASGAETLGGDPSKAPAGGA